MATTTSSFYADVTETSPSDWSYISEGGATIVFSYCGPPNTSFTGTVLRLRKIELQPPPKEIFKPLDYAEGVPSSDEDDGEESSDDEDEPDDPSIAFQYRVTSKLISPKHLPRLEAVKLKKHWLEALQKLGEKNRPESRRKVDRVDVNKKKGVLATDLVGGAGWAVEIKPKWAFLPNPQHLSDETRETKLLHCRFCMHTHQRAIKAPKKFIPKYCPLDLYSGNEARVSKALGDLWDAWVGSDGSLNNLKLFISGSSISPSDVNGVEGLAEQLGQTTKQGLPHSEILDSLRPIFVATLLPVLVKTTLFTNLALLQRTLDPLDIEGVAKLWSASGMDVHPPSTPVGIGSQEVTLNEWERFMGEYSSQVEGAYARSWAQLQSEWDKPPLDKLRHYMLAYLMSATFKDCSVIVRLPGATGTAIPTITAIDLDPKSVTRLARWEDLDRDIVMSYVASGDHTTPPCVDARVGVGHDAGVYGILLEDRAPVEKNQQGGGLPIVWVCVAFLIGLCFSYYL